MRLIASATLALALAVTLFGSGTAVGGPLDGHLSAYNGWTGSTPFDDDGDPNVLEGDGLEGSVDWAVFTKSDFDSLFLGYSPPAGQLAYTYQVNVAGTLPVSSLSVGINNQPTGTIGSFSGGGVTGVAPVGTSLGAFAADFSFVGNTIPVGSTSAGLVFSSPNIPEDYFGSVIDGGSSAYVIPLPTPSPNPIPEPSTALLLGAGLVLLMFRRRI